MQLHLDILPAAQLKLWHLLKDIPKEFILYGGTAVALQLGHLTFAIGFKKGTVNLTRIKMRRKDI